MYIAQPYNEVNTWKEQFAQKKKIQPLPTHSLMESSGATQQKNATARWAF